MEELKIVKKMKPKTAFVLGLGSALGLFFVVGFFILLVMVMGDNNNVKAVNNDIVSPSPSAAAVAQPNSGKVVLNPVDKKTDWIKGDPKAKISIVEFSDTECPYCKRFHETMNQIVDEYSGQVNWVYRHFPLTSLHPKAAKEAEALECAGEQGGNDGFWAYTNRLFEITPGNNRLEPSQLPEIADDIGLDVDQFEECLASGKYAAKVQDHVKQAQVAGGKGTPYSVIVAGDQMSPLSGALPSEQLKAIIDSLLQ
ncbi:MAG: thioredoxin domain-containing protein [Candidatus Komeilibacteria bacterium]